MGIDFKTWGRTGYEVRAVDEAISCVFEPRLGAMAVSFISGMWMAGRPVCLISAAVGPARERVEVAQRTAERYSVDLWFKPGEIPVRRGDVIALSGESDARSSTSTLNCATRIMVC